MSGGKQGGLPQDAGSGLNAGRPPLGGVQLNSQGRTPPGFMSAGDAFKLARQQQVNGNLGRDSLISRLFSSRPSLQ